MYCADKPVMSVDCLIGDIGGVVAKVWMLKQMAAMLQCAIRDLQGAIVPPKLTSHS